MFFQGKIHRVEKARRELETEIENIAKQKNMLEQMITEVTEDKGLNQ